MTYHVGRASYVNRCKQRAVGQRERRPTSSHGPSADSVLTIHAKLAHPGLCRALFAGLERDGIGVGLASGQAPGARWRKLAPAEWRQFCRRASPALAGPPSRLRGAWRGGRLPPRSLEAATTCPPTIASTRLSPSEVCKCSPKGAGHPCGLFGFERYRRELPANDAGGCQDQPPAGETTIVNMTDDRLGRCVLEFFEKRTLAARLNGVVCPSCTCRQRATLAPRCQALFAVDGAAAIAPVGGFAMRVVVARVLLTQQNPCHSDCPGMASCRDCLTLSAAGRIHEVAGQTHERA